MANNVICIGANLPGSFFNDRTYIANIYASFASGRQVFIDSDGQLGTAASTRRVKDDIKPMDKASEVLLSLKPVTFRYKKEIDRTGTAQFGLVAEEVEKMNPDLVVKPCLSYSRSRRQARNRAVRGGERNAAQ